MRILSVAPFIHSGSAASWRAWNIAKILQSGGHNVHLVQYAGNATLRELQGTNLDLNGISTSVVQASKFTVHVKHLKELFRHDYDLVYGNAHMATFWSMLGRLKGTPLIFDMHGALIEEFLLINQSNRRWKYSSSLFSFLLNNFIDFFDVHFSNKIICVSNKMINYLRSERGVPLEKMAYVTNGVDLDFFKPITDEQVLSLKRRLGLEDKFVFGYIGGLEKWQGVETFIEAAKGFNTPDLAFVVVGGNEQPQKGGVSLIPRVPRSQIPEYYSICDVLVLPRPNHTAAQVAAPTKFAEYTAMGKPILCTNVGDAADLTRRYGAGIVTEDNSVATLREGILQFKSKSETDLRKIGENSRELAQQEFDWNKVANNLLKAIES